MEFPTNDPRVRYGLLGYLLIGCNPAPTQLWPNHTDVILGLVHFWTWEKCLAEVLSLEFQKEIPGKEFNSAEPELSLSFCGCGMAATPVRNKIQYRSRLRTRIFTSHAQLPSTSAVYMDALSNVFGISI